MQLMPGVGPTSAQRVLNCMLDAADPIGALAWRAIAASGRRFLGGLHRDNHRTARGPRGWPAELEERASGMNRISIASTRIPSAVTPI